MYLDGTIAESIAYGCRPAILRFAAKRAASRVYQPDGYDTQSCGQRGTRLSGGSAFHCALQKPSTAHLDEATSADSESGVQFRSLSGGKCFHAGHCSSTFDNYGRCYHQHGRAAPDELLKKGALVRCANRKAIKMAIGALRNAACSLQTDGSQPD